MLTLTEWAIVSRDRDTRVRAAAEAGITRCRIEQLTSPAKTTIIRILRDDGPQEPSHGPGGQVRHDLDGRLFARD